MMNTSRHITLSQLDNDGSSVVYVMSRDQRVDDNHALLAAQVDAVARRAPLIVLFNLNLSPKNRSYEHYEFMLEGLEEVAEALERMGINWIMRSDDAYSDTIAVLSATKAASVYFDFSPLASPRKLAKKVATSFSGATYVVDTHNIVPVWRMSDKQEFAAHTLRKKVHKQLASYVVAPESLSKHSYKFDGSCVSDSFETAREKMNGIQRSGVVLSAKPGEKAAHKHLKEFLANELGGYANGRNDIAHDHQSGLSPYLHFGQLSSLRVALETIAHVKEDPLLFMQARMASATAAHSEREGMDALFEEMIVRKELSDNFCFYSEYPYTSIAAAASWAQKTLDEHRDDVRDFLYSDDEWEYSKTHDDAWNAAQNQLRKTGKMHGYMRMYWAKKMLEWSSSPEDALRVVIYLNDKYSIDGGDPNGYVGILWSIAGLHDRPWTERPVFGKIRYMNAGGLKRKFDVAAYVNEWS